jgi:class 3 adenylate cyclase
MIEIGRGVVVTEVRSSRPTLPPAVQPARAVVWVLHLALPIGALWLLLARPEVDVRWQHPPSHFWLVLAVAVVNVGVGLRMGTAARKHTDARLFLVSLAFLTSAGFFALHALATPGVIVTHPNAGFDLAQPVGLALASVFALASCLSYRPERARSTFRVLLAVRALVALLLLAWAAVSLLDLPPLGAAPPAREVEGPLVWVAAGSVVLYGLTALRFYLLHRRSPAAVLLSLVTAYTLLAEAMVAVILANKWHLSWWEWHVLLTFAFGFVAYSAYVQYRREGSSAGIFDVIGLASTARRIRAEYEAALEELVGELQERERSGEVDGGASLAPRLAQRFALTEGQVAVLERAGRALAAERGLTRRLGALVEAGERARVGLAEQELLGQLLTHVRPAYGDVDVALVSDGRMVVDGRAYEPGAFPPPGPYPLPDGDAMLYPLTVKGHLAGVLRVPGRAGDPMIATLANQVSITLENARLYRELGTLFRQYMSPDVASALLADPDQAALGGSVVEVTALFADLRGFTTFSEAVDPPEIVRMLNRYHAVAVPCILDNGGTIVQFVGDALLALFNAPARQADHAARAVRAALAMQAAVESIARSEPDWPRLRVGANTGPALVGNIGSETLRGFNAMGDAVNVAARLQGLAEPGQVVIGEATLLELGDTLRVRPLGELTVKGRQQPVRAYVVTGPAT